MKMTVADQIKILDRKIMQNEAESQTKQQLKYLHCLLITWINTNIWLVKIQILSAALLNQQDLSILRWVKFVLKD